MEHTGFITQPVSDGERDKTFVLSERLVMDAFRTPLCWFTEKQHCTHTCERQMSNRTFSLSFALKHFIF